MPRMHAMPLSKGVTATTMSKPCTHALELHEHAAQGVLVHALVGAAVVLRCAARHADDAQAVVAAVVHALALLAWIAFM